MKYLFSILTIASALFSANAGVFSRYQNQWTTIYTNVTFSSNITSSVTFTNNQATDISLYHTFQISNVSAGTNTVTVTLDRTIDQTNWNPVYTNQIGTNSFGEFTATGKWIAYRWRVTALGTNLTVTANYMAQ